MQLRCKNPHNSEEPLGSVIKQERGRKEKEGEKQNKKAPSLVHCMEMWLL